MQSKEQARHWWQCEWDNESCPTRATEWVPEAGKVVCDWHATVLKAVNEVMA